MWVAKLYGPHFCFNMLAHPILDSPNLAIHWHDVFPALRSNFFVSM